VLCNITRPTDVARKWHHFVHLTVSFRDIKAAASKSPNIAGSTPEAYSRDVFTFVESSIFRRVLPAYLNDDEYSELQQYLIQNPEAGEIVPGSGGIRKVRWARSGAGKRGGLRIIYFVRYRPNEFWMLTLYAKAKRENIPAHILKQLLEGFRDG
jgi:hypothetical protein